MTSVNSNEENMTYVMILAYYMKSNCIYIVISDCMMILYFNENVIIDRENYCNTEEM